MIIKIKRQAAPNAVPHYVSFEYSGDENISAAELLSAMNAGEFAGDRIVWECACLEGRCGACAMRVNGRPSLACKAQLRAAGHGGELTLEPLAKFPVKKDLTVDRSAMLACGSPCGTAHPVGRMAFAAAQCLSCGCCLDICPVYRTGGTFPGAAGFLRKYLEGTLTSADTASCLRCGACGRICPQNIHIAEYISAAEWQ